jgi:hypothetical protein
MCNLPNTSILIQAISISLYQTRAVCIVLDMLRLVWFQILTRLELERGSMSSPTQTAKRLAFTSLNSNTQF